MPTASSCEQCESTFRYYPSSPRRFCSRTCWYDRKRLGESAKQRSVRSAKLKYRYSLTLDQYDAMIEEQAGGCAICGGLNASGRRLGVDHDHACCPEARSCGNCIRGLLCDNCNSILGQASDDVSRLRRCIQYLEGSV